MMKNLNDQTIRPQFISTSDESGIQLNVALPGVKKEHLNVSSEKQILTISGERESLIGEYHRRDSEPPRFELKLNIHEDLDLSQTKATLSDGLLTLELPKRPELAPRKIDILAN